MTLSFSAPWAPSFFASFTTGDDSRPHNRASRRDDRAVERADVRREAVANAIGGVAVPELLDRLRHGERGALSTLYMALYDELWHIAVLQTRSAEIASEVVQDVFLWLWAHREEIRRETDVRVYLAVAVRNRARTLHRHARVVDAVAESEAWGPEGEGALAMGRPAAPADALAEESEFREAYARAVATLTEQERLAVFLRWEEEWAFERIGAVLSLSNVGARKVVLRAQRKVQALLAEYRG